MSARAWAAFAAVSALWGIPYLFIKVAVDDGVPPAFLAWSRVVLGAVVLLALSHRFSVLGQVRGHWRWIAAYAVIEIAIPFPLIAAGEQRVSSSLAAILIAAVPLIVAVLALRFDHRERVDRRRLVGLLIGFAGVIVLVGIDVAGSSRELVGAAFVLLAAVGYAAGPMLLNRKFPTVDPRAAMGATLLVAAVVLTPFAALDVPAGTPSDAALASIAVLGLACTALALVLFNMLVTEVGAGRATVITYVAPVVAVACGVAVLGERPGPGAVAGLLLILAGSWLSTDGRVPPGLARMWTGRRTSRNLRPLEPEPGANPCPLRPRRFDRGENAPVAHLSSDAHREGAMGHGAIGSHSRVGGGDQDRVLAVVRENAASLLRIARQHSLCADDAQDAYQRALVIYLERAERVDPSTAGSYLRTIVKHEAMSIRESRQRIVAEQELDFDEYLGEAGEPGERAEAFERIARAAEALRGCKHDEVVALFLRAEGSSYAEIGRMTGWTHTKVNRCLVEGRARFMRGYSAIEDGKACERWAPILSALVDDMATAEDVAGVRLHLRNCSSCRFALRELHEGPAVLTALIPAGLLAVAPQLGDGGAGLLSRLYEAMVGGIGEKVAASGLKVQAAVDAVSTGKVAAVAASAAAIAGGGAFTVDRAVLEPKRDRDRASERRAALRSARAAQASTKTVASAPVPTAAARRPQEVRPAPRRKPMSRQPGRARQEFGFEVAAGSDPAPRDTSPRATTSSASRPKAIPARRPKGTRASQSEFGFE